MRALGSFRSHKATTSANQQQYGKDTLSATIHDILWEPSTPESAGTMGPPKPPKQVNPDHQASLCK